MIFVDSCVLIDVIEEDPAWSGWSQSALDEWGRRGPVCIGPVVYAERSPDYDTPAPLDNLLERAGIEFREMPREALFLAARVHQDYRRRGGGRSGVLSDFFIGAHARVANVPLLTRDTRRFRAAYPDLVLVAP